MFGPRLVAPKGGVDIVGLRLVALKGGVDIVGPRLVALKGNVDIVGPRLVALKSGVDVLGPKVQTCFASYLHPRQHFTTTTKVKVCQCIMLFHLYAKHVTFISDQRKQRYIFGE